MNIIIKNVALEVTRRCNLECRHCMRGDSQNIDMDYKYIDYVLRNNHLIMVLFFSGGEPLLNSKAIIYTINKIIDENLEVLAIGFNTNGTIYDEELIDALLRYTQYALKNFSEFYQEKFHNTPVGITFSDDQYHQNNDDVIEKYLKTKDKIKYTKTGKLDVLDDDLLLSGRGKDMFFGRYFEFKNKPLDIMKLDDDSYILNNDFYITANGDITTQGDGSYSDMDIDNFGRLNSNSFYNFVKEKYENRDDKLLIKHILK